MRRVQVEHQYIGNNDETETDQSKYFARRIGKYLDRSVRTLYYCNLFPTSLFRSCIRFAAKLPKSPLRIQTSVIHQTCPPQDHSGRLHHGRSTLAYTISISLSQKPTIFQEGDSPSVACNMRSVLNEEGPHWKVLEGSRGRIRVACIGS